MRDNIHIVDILLLVEIRQRSHREWKFGRGVVRVESLNLGPRADGAGKARGSRTNDGARRVLEKRSPGERFTLSRGFHGIAFGRDELLADFRHAPPHSLGIFCRTPTCDTPPKGSRMRRIILQQHFSRKVVPKGAAGQIPRSGLLGSRGGSCPVTALEVDCFLVGRDPTATSLGSRLRDRLRSSPQGGTTIAPESGCCVLPELPSSRGLSTAPYG